MWLPFCANRKLHFFVKIPHCHSTLHLNMLWFLKIISMPFFKVCFPPCFSTLLLTLPIWVCRCYRVWTGVEIHFESFTACSNFKCFINYDILIFTTRKKLPWQFSDFSMLGCLHVNSQAWKPPPLHPLLASPVQPPFKGHYKFRCQRVGDSIWSWPKS